MGQFLSVAASGSEDADAWWAVELTEKPEQPHGFLGSLPSLPCWFSFCYCKGSHQSTWRTHHLLGKPITCLANPSPAQALGWPQQWVSVGLQDGDGRCSPTSWATKKRTEELPHVFPVKLQLDESNEKSSRTSPCLYQDQQWPIHLLVTTVGCCPCRALPSHVDTMEAAHQAEVPAAEELCHLSPAAPSR